ncbi:MAG: hypothetical protein KDA41_16160 [Planctomycetales bacterium]|nr:hypothetical protein [Planctomycetales bacterium]
MKREHLYWAFIGGGAVVIGVLVAWMAGAFQQEKPLPPVPVVIERLNKPASAEQQVGAAKDLIRHGAKARTEVRAALANHAKYEPEVMAPLLQATMKNRDYQSMPVLLDLLDHPDPLVRGRAAAAAQQILGGRINYRANDAPEVRAKAAAEIRRQYEELKPRLVEFYETGK